MATEKTTPATHTEASLKAMKTSELWLLHAQLGLGVTNEKRRNWVVARILEAQAGAAGEDAGQDAAEPVQPAAEGVTEVQAGEDGDTSAPSAEEPAKRTRDGLADLSVDELLARYTEVVGRPTNSNHRGYLIWKIREATKGRVPVGPTQRQAKRDPAVKMMTLPLAMPEPTVEALDAAWKRLGFKSRIALLRDAAAAMLEARGEAETAVAVRAG